MSERPRPRHHVLECLGEKPPGSGSKACGRYVHRSIGAVALVLFAASCGSLPEEPPLRPTSRPPPHAVQPEQLSEAPIEHHTLPSACVDGGSMCTVPVDFAERLCRGLYPEVALHLFGPKTPWKRAFLLRSFKAWHVGSRSDLRELRTGEEVIILTTSGGGGSILGGTGRAFDVLRWDGTCVSLMEDELSFHKPPAASPANINLKKLDSSFRLAFAEDKSIDQLRAAESKTCDLANAEKEPGRSKCELSRRQLSLSIAQSIAHGKTLPPPGSIP